MIVAVEGLDGSGKTTASRILAHAIGGRYVAVPPPKLKLTTTALFADISSDARYLYYLSGVLAVADMNIGAEVLVADRFVASAHALHLKVNTPLADELRRLPLPTPDLTFYLHADEAVRRRRLRERGSPLDAFERLLDVDELFRQRVAEQMQAYPRTYLIDTSHRAPAEVALKARELWESLSRSTG
jgi:thymidylate kinase